MYICESEVRAKLDELCCLLQNNGYTACIIEDAFQDHMGKLSLSKASEHYGKLVVNYSPNRKRYTQQYSEIRNSEVKVDVKRICEQPATVEVVPPHSLEEVQHYHTLLKPYENCRFDFVVLADAILRVDPNAGDREAIRFNFPQLETIFNQMKEA